jgi:chromosome segregation ATPase
MSLVGKRKFTSTQGNLNNNAQDDNIKLAEIIKEKDDLQEMNEKMLDLLTEKELENEDLLQKLENYKLESKIENEKNLVKIQSLEEKIEKLESSKGAELDIDDIINEYNNYKERLKGQISEYLRNEENLKQDIDIKERTIQKLKEEIQGLEMENLQLVSQSESKEKFTQNERIELEQLKSENEKIKRDFEFLSEKLKISEQNNDKLNKLFETEVSSLKEKLENEQKNYKAYKEAKMKEIEKLKNDSSKNLLEISTLNKKIENFDKLLNDIKQTNFIIQNKLDKKNKEIQDINEYTKKLLSNKENLLKQYEKKIDLINKDKNNLISQNKELLEKIKMKNEEVYASNLAEILNEDEEANEDINHYSHENKLLNEEIKNLKEQIANQAQDLVELNSLEKEVERLKVQNEELVNKNKNIQKHLDNLKKQIGERRPSVKRRELNRNIMNMARKTTCARRKSNAEKNGDIFRLKKKLEAITKLKEDEKKELVEEIDKLKYELAEFKIQNLNKQYEADSLLIKYRNCIKMITNQCIKKGIKLKINSLNIKTMQ